MSTPRIRKAVFPVAGMGTRFLPATKAIPKEMLPVVDKPVIQYGVEEAREAGIEQFIFVTGRGKHVIADHFDHAYELESLLTAREKTKELNSLLESLPDTGSVSFTRQQKPLGLGHAVLCARHLVGDEPFAVVLPDDLMVGKPGALKQMVDAYHEIGGGVVVAAEEKSREETQRLRGHRSGPHQRRDHRGQGRGRKAQTRGGPFHALHHWPLYPAARHFRRTGAARKGAPATRSSSPTPWRGCWARFPSMRSPPHAPAMITVATRSVFCRPISRRGAGARRTRAPALEAHKVSTLKL